MQRQILSVMGAALFALGQALNVCVLPALFVQGRQVRFPYGVAELSELIEGPIVGNGY